MFTKTENQILTLISEVSSITTEQLGFVHIEAGCIEADIIWVQSESN